MSGSSDKENGDDIIDDVDSVRFIVDFISWAEG